MKKRPNILFLYGEEIPEVLFDLEQDPGETVNFAGAPEYAEAMQRFRVRLSELGHGPHADPNYVNAGYQAVGHGALRDG